VPKQNTEAMKASESSLNPYMAVINQDREDRGWARPALGHYFRLARAPAGVRPALGHRGHCSSIDKKG
jgi:hypothetical protein